MLIQSIEPTPNPNKMKITVDETLPRGVTMSCTDSNQPGAPDYMKRLIDIDGVQSVFRAVNFITLERTGTGDWKEIFRQLPEALTETQQQNQAQEGSSEQALEDAFVSDVRIFVQMFQGIPMQIKLRSGLEETRVGLPDRFREAVMRASTASTNIIAERHWEPYGVRAGDATAIGEQVAREIDQAYPEERLRSLVEGRDTKQVDTRQLSSDRSKLDWKERYSALNAITPTIDQLPRIREALRDTNAAVRRLATAYLGAIGSADVLSDLIQALSDPSITVRRTAGDSLSDIGHPSAIGPMIEALKDPSKLVRWRAARFLYEVGDASALPALQEAESDPAYEVALQARLAAERIRSGESATGPMWRQLTKGLEED